MTAEEFLSRFPRTKRNGPGDWHAPCPAHDDNTVRPEKFSLHVTATDDRILLKCFAGCSVEAVLHELALPASALFYSDLTRSGPSRPAHPVSAEPADPGPVPTLDAFAALKRLPRALLEDAGWTDAPWGIRIPYRQRDGSLWRERKRTSLLPGSGFLWGTSKGSGLIPYGRDRLDSAMDRGELWLVEGESDTMTAWHHRLPAIGLPGNLTGSALTAADLAGIDTLWLLQEPGQSGIGFALNCRERLVQLGWTGTAKLVRVPAKDLSALHMADPEGFEAALRDAQALAVDLFAWLAPKDEAEAPAMFSEGAGELLARDFPPVVVFIENILTSEGSGFIGGEEKLGKTYLALDEGVSLALGIPLGGRFPVPIRRRVLFIEEEDSPRRTRLRLRALCRGHGFDPDDPAFQANLSAWLRVSVWQGFRLDEPRWLERLTAELHAFPADVVYLDVLRKLSGKDLNKADQAASLFDALDRIRRERAVIFRVLHHYRKSQGIRMGRGSQEMGGSYVLGAWAEQSIFLEPVGRRGGGVSVDVQSKDGASGQGYRLRFESEGPAHDPTWIRLRLDDPKADQAPGEKHADQVLEALATLPHEPSPNGPGVTVKAIAEALKIDRAVVIKTIRFLRENGLCEENHAPSTKNRRYRCKDAAEPAISLQREKGELF